MDCVSEVIVNLPISNYDLLLQVANVPALALQLVQLSKLLPLLLVEMVQIWMH